MPSFAACSMIALQEMSFGLLASNVGIANSSWTLATLAALTNSTSNGALDVIAVGNILEALVLTGAAIPVAAVASIVTIMSNVCLLHLKLTAR